MKTKLSDPPKQYDIYDFLRYKREIKNYCWRLMGRYNRAPDGELLYSDLTVDVINLLEKKPHFKNDEHFLKYMMQLTRWKFNDVIKSEKIRQTKYVASYSHGDSEYDNKHVYQGEVVHEFGDNLEIYNMINGLSYFRKKIVYLRYNGYTVREISELCGCNIDTIFLHLKEIKEKLIVCI